VSIFSGQKTDGTIYSVQQKKFQSWWFLTSQWPWHYL